jgi:hypothetical protein
VNEMVFEENPEYPELNPVVKLANAHILEYQWPGMLCEFLKDKQLIGKAIHHSLRVYVEDLGDKSFACLLENNTPCIQLSSQFICRLKILALEKEIIRKMMNG